MAYTYLELLKVEDVAEAVDEMHDPPKEKETRPLRGTKNLAFLDFS